jgi:ketosteroid isomerase-like protein
MSRSTRHNVHFTPFPGALRIVHLPYKNRINEKRNNMTTTQEKTRTTQEVATRFHELAQQEKWFEIQDEFFSEDVRSFDPEGSPYFGYAEGKAAVRRKGEEFVSRIEAVHSLRTTAPIVSCNHFVVGREKDITVRPHGRIVINEIMLYEVRDGRIVLEQFFY